MTGHVFVVQGNALKIACDELLIPTDGGGTVSDGWSDLNPPVLPGGWESGAPRVSDAIVRNHQRVRWVNTGSFPEVARQQRDWLRDGVREAMMVAAEGLRRKALSTGARGR